MRTTVDLPDDLLDEVQRAAGVATKREALIIAMEEYLRRSMLKRVAEAAGTLEFDLDAREIRDLDERGSEDV